MKYFSYILTVLLLAVNTHFTHAFVVETSVESTMMECNMKCCNQTDSSGEKEKPNCCSDAYCNTSITSAHAINYSYTPKIPIDRSEKEFLPLVYNYSNFYSLSHTNDFWNPPKV